MLTIKMLSDKSLVITKPMKIYQRQSLVDNFQILVPSRYENIDLTVFSCTLEWIDAATVVHSELLQADEELYNDTFIRYTLDMDSKFTYLAGTNIMKLNLTYLDTSSESQKKYILKTGEVEVTVLSLNDYFVYVDDSSLSRIDNEIMKLQAETQKLAAAADIYAQKQPDDLVMDDSALLQLSANGKAIGEGVLLASPVIEDDDKDDGVIDLNNAPDENEIAVIDL